MNLFFNAFYHLVLTAYKEFIIMYAGKKLYVSMNMNDLSAFFES